MYAIKFGFIVYHADRRTSRNFSEFKNNYYNIIYEFLTKFIRQQI